MSPDPTKQECHGQYLYGAGYFARDENTLSLVTSGDQGRQHFCLMCPRMASCEAEHERRVRQDQPAATELFDRRIRRAEQRGYSTIIVKFMLGQNGLDPFATAAVENFNRGHAERGMRSGLIVHSDVDPNRQ